MANKLNQFNSSLRYAEKMALLLAIRAETANHPERKRLELMDGIGAGVGYHQFAERQVRTSARDQALPFYRVGDSILPSEYQRQAMVERFASAETNIGGGEEGK